MKRPKQQTGGPLSFLNFFSRKPKSEARPEKPAEARPKEEVAITLTLSQQLPHQVRADPLKFGTWNLDWNRNVFFFFCN